ncbi:hypothetical protein VITFI_CDS1294 [Vitreoscilla filiformis]|uniref:Uncharacterized protein n=1 Tax=Vitreoscilla filiformis TaxID=63 RepID=A0A221KDH1_VITFI|nr:hypothetical protein VITFI_CDS1294 [Vitreoscilla filiformis]
MAALRLEPTGLWALVIANAITLPLAGSILGTKLYEDWRRRRHPRLL